MYRRARVVVVVVVHTANGGTTGSEMISKVRPRRARVQVNDLAKEKHLNIYRATYNNRT